MNLRFLSLCVVIVAYITAEAQSKLSFKDKFMYTDVLVSNKKNIHSILSLIDTGSSLCVIDSTFAVGSWGVNENELKTVYVNQTQVKISSAIIDSIYFCGNTYHKVYCLIADLTGIYQKYAPRFIVGADILKSGAWKFDMERNSIEPYDYNKKTIGTVFRWKNHKDYSDVAIDYIIFDSKINGKKTRFAFDTGCKSNKLPRGIYVGATEEIPFAQTTSIRKGFSLVHRFLNNFLIAFLHCHNTNRMRCLCCRSEINRTVFAFPILGRRLL